MFISYTELSAYVASFPDHYTSSFFSYYLLFYFTELGYHARISATRGTATAAATPQQTRLQT